MSTYPSSPRTDFLAWCQSHAATFLDNAAEIGLTAAQATAFNTQTAATASSLNDHNIAQDAARTQTQVTNDMFAALRATAGTTVQIIKAFAEASADPNTVYALANIPQPQPPKPGQPPAQPTDLTVELMPQTGALVLRWKASNPAGLGGTSYIIRRRLPGESAWTFVGVPAKKEFVDDTFVAGPDSVQYTVQGTRSGILGPLSQVFLVSFGISPSGAMTSSAAAAAPGKGIPLHVSTLPNGNGGGYAVNGNGSSAYKTTRQRVGV